MLLKQLAIILGDSPNFIPALVAVEAEFLPLEFELRTLLGQHVVKGEVPVLQKLVLQSLQFILVLEAAPLERIAESEKLILLLDEALFGFLILLEELIACGEEVAEGLPLVQVVLEVLGEALVHHVAELLDVDAGAGHDAGQVLE